MKRVFISALCLLFGVQVALADKLKNPQQQLLEEVDIDQKLNAPLPLELTFRDETGRAVKLGDYFGERPVMLALVYYECPMLCTMVLNGITRTLRMLSLDAGADYELVLVSIDPRETPELAAAKKETYLQMYQREGTDEGWHFLTGDEKSIRLLASAVGFRYTYDDETKQYAHAAGLMVATPRGRLSHYFYGIEYATRDLRMAVIEASGGKIGSPVDRVLLYCFHYDPTTGKYGLVITRVIRLTGAITLAAVLGGIGLSLWRERRRSRKAESLEAV